MRAAVTSQPPHAKVRAPHALAGLEPRIAARIACMA
jgi:hypothetical protein